MIAPQFRRYGPPSDVAILAAGAAEIDDDTLTVLAAARRRPRPMTGGLDNLGTPSRWQIAEIRALNRWTWTQFARALGALGIFAMPGTVRAWGEGRAIPGQAASAALRELRRRAVARREMEGSTMSTSNALATVPAVAAPHLVTVRDEWTDERIEFIRRTYCGNAPDAIAETFIALARRRGLSPEERHIYLVPRGGDWTIQTGIDGYRLIADRTGLYAGSDEPIFVDSGKTVGKGLAYPTKASVTIWKLVGGQRVPFTGVALWDEYNAGVNLWLTKPHAMLAKCAEAQALRKGFPAQLSNIYTDDEMAQAGSVTVQEVRTPNGVVDAATGEILDAGGSERERLMRRLHAQATGDGLFPEEADKHEALHDLAAAVYPVKGMGHLSEQQLRAMVTWLRKQDPDASQLALRWARIIAVADTTEELDLVVSSLVNDAIDDALLTKAIERRGKEIAELAKIDRQVASVMVP